MHAAIVADENWGFMLEPARMNRTNQCTKKKRCTSSDPSKDIYRVPRRWELIITPFVIWQCAGLIPITPSTCLWKIIDVFK